MNDNPTGKDYVGSDELYAGVQRCMRLMAEMNSGYHTEAEVREYLRQITASEIDETVRVFPPFNINYGRKTTFGKGSFVNFGNDGHARRQLHASHWLLCHSSPSAASPSRRAPSSLRIACWPPSTTPKTRLAPFAAHQAHRHRPRCLDRCQRHHPRGWEFSSGERREGSLRPSSIDENAIVAAGAVVSKDVPANTIVGGVPAKVIREIHKA